MTMSTAARSKGERYGAIDGLRTYAAIGVAIMHVRANGYELSGFVGERIIGELGDFVFLFMVISAFSLCCGYYERMMNGQITPAVFYQKRFAKIWPFFAVLCIMDVILSPSKAALYELFANLTLCFGLLPNPSIEVIGVSWFIGLIFVFYLVFPFFCYLISSTRRAWLSMIAAVVFHCLCNVYFFDGNHVVEGFDARANIVYCAPYFLAGGIIYRYRDPLKGFSERNSKLILAAGGLSGAAYLLAGSSMLTRLLFSVVVLIYAIGRGDQQGVLQNRFTRFISGISMEIYLCHMVFYRVIEKLHLLHMFEYEVLSYIVACTLVLTASVVFSAAMQRMIGKVKRGLKRESHKAARS